jgi:hypothetical protein
MIFIYAHVKIQNTDKYTNSFYFFQTIFLDVNVTVSVIPFIFFFKIRIKYQTNPTLNIYKKIDKFKFTIFDTKQYYLRY